MTITKIGETGVTVIDGFCTREEAQELITYARERVGPAAVLEDGEFVLSDGRQSETCHVFGPRAQNPRFVAFASRAAALTGMPYTHLDGVFITRYGPGGFYHEHHDFGDHFKDNRLYTILLYLNDMDESEGGTTAFPRLNVEVQPRVGRAVSWTNKNPDGSPHWETSHAALPVKEGAEKWTIQFWFNPYQRFKELDPVVPQMATGQPIDQHHPLPDGANYFDPSSAAEVQHR